MQMLVRSLIAVIATLSLVLVANQAWADHRENVQRQRYAQVAALAHTLQDDTRELYECFRHDSIHDPCFREFLPDTWKMYAAARRLHTNSGNCVKVSALQRELGRIQQAYNCLRDDLADHRFDLTRSHRRLLGCMDETLDALECKINELADQDFFDASNNGTHRHGSTTILIPQGSSPRPYSPRTNDSWNFGTQGFSLRVGR